MTIDPLRLVYDFSPQYTRPQLPIDLSSICTSRAYHSACSHVLTVQSAFMLLTSDPSLL